MLVENLHDLESNKRNVTRGVFCKRLNDVFFPQLYSKLSKVSEWRREMPVKNLKGYIIHTNHPRTTIKSFNK